MKDYNIQHIGIIVLYGILLSLSALFTIEVLNSYIQPLYGFCFILLLILTISTANKNPIASVYSIGVFFYYYQVPFINSFKEFDVGVYNINFNNYTLAEYYFLYTLLIGIHIVLALLLTNMTNEFNSFKKNISLIKSNRMIIISLLLAVLFLLYAFKNSGGVIPFFMLNKFESVQYAKVLFFTWKEFVIIAMGIYFLSENKNKLFFIFFIIFLIVELLTAKRLLILFLGVFIYVSYIKRLTYKKILLLLGALFFVNFTKYTYYNMKNVVVRGDSLDSLFWFEWSDFFMDLIYMNEFSAHLRLSYLYLYYDIETSIYTFKDQLLTTLPFSSYLNLGYLGAGENLKIYLSESWSGLASSVYIIPYKGAGLIGLIIIYGIYVLIIKSLAILSKKDNFFRILFYINIPFIFFYIQREEIMVITKNLFITSLGLSIIILISLLWGAVKRMVSELIT